MSMMATQAREFGGPGADRGVTVRGIEAVRSPPGRHEELIRDVLAEASAARLRPVIGQVFPLERAADAHAALPPVRPSGRPC
jgi:NADPH:quinone reductase-like Zn-dependent oxidoreductase